MGSQWSRIVLRHLERRLHGQHVGTFGDVGTFSFSATRPSPPAKEEWSSPRDETLAARLRMVRGQGQSFKALWPRFSGFNYRMTNIAAAIGLAQIERLEATLARKRAIGARYRADSAGTVTFQQPGEGVFGADWLTSVLLPSRHGPRSDAW